MPPTKKTAAPADSLEAPQTLVKPSSFPRPNENVTVGAPGQPPEPYHPESA